MLVYASNDYIDVADSDIEVLKRSTDSRVLDAGDAGSFDLEAYLCLHRHEGVPLCHIAFYYRPLKRSVVFAVIGADHGEALLREAEATLEPFGYTLDRVNLSFSPAMLQVLLRDIPALKTPEKVSQFRKERQALLADLEAQAEPTDDRPEGDRTARQRLAAEQRKDGELATLRQVLEQRLAPPAEPDAGQGDVAQLRTLQAELRDARADLEAEREERAMAEQILAAAEKRLRELEETLVEYETQASGSVKQGQKLLELSKRVEQLEAQLVEAGSQVEAAELKCREVEAVAEQAGANQDAFEAEYQQLVARHDDLTAEKESLARELDEARTEAAALTAQLRDVQDQAETTSRQDDRLAELEARVETLAGECEALQNRAKTAEAEQERLARDLDERSRRCAELEDRLERADKALALGETAETADAVRDELVEARKQLEEETSNRQELARELDEARLRLRTMEKGLAKAPPAGNGAGDDAALEAANRKIEQLLQDIDCLKEALEDEQETRQDLEKAQAKAELKLEVLKEELVQARSQAPVQQVVQVVEAPATENGAKEPERKSSRGPLPHELRKPSPKDAFFHVNWDLQGIPCSSVEQIVEAWGSIFNVSLTLEGYPTQYCSAFIVVVKAGKQKNLYMFFNLKQNKYTLVYQPGKGPKNDKEMKMALEEARRFMMVSGVEFEALSKDEIASRLSAYVVQG